MSTLSIPECRYDVASRFYVVICRQCGSSFKVRPEAKRRRYCSDRCYAASHPCHPRTNLWTPAQIKQLRALAGTLPVREIANRIGRPYEATKKKAQALGVPLRLIGDYHPYVKYSDAQVEEARVLSDEGVPTRKIAARLGVPNRTVEDWIQYRARLGFTPKVW